MNDQKVVWLHRFDEHLKGASASSQIRSWRNVENFCCCINKNDQHQL